MIKRLLVIMMLVLSVASFGLETSKTIERKPEKLTLKNFKGAQLGLSEVVSLTSYVGTLSYKKGIEYKKISLADTQYSFGRNNLPPVELLFINEEL